MKADFTSLTFIESVAGYSSSAETENLPSDSYETFLKFVSRNV